MGWWGGGMNSTSLNDLISSLGLLWIMAFNMRWCAPHLGWAASLKACSRFEPFFSITYSTQTFIGKLSLCWPPCSEVTRPSAVHGSRTSCSQKKGSFLPAPFLLAFCGCSDALSAFSCHLPEHQSFSSKGELSSFAISLQFI